MSHELVGLGLGWLAHLAWYVARPRDGRPLVEFAVTIPTPVRILALALAVGSAVALGARHGAALGVSCMLGVVTAAASFHVIAGPLSPRIVLGGGAVASVLLLIGALGG